MMTNLVEPRFRLLSIIMVFRVSVEITAIRQETLPLIDKN